MKRLLIIAFTFILGFSTLALAAVWQTFCSQNSGIEVNVHQVSYRTLRVEYCTDPGLISACAAEGELPVATRWIALSRAGDVSLRILDSQTIELPAELSDIVVSSFSNETRTTSSPCHPFVIDNQSLSFTESASSGWVMRNVRFVPITFQPVIESDGDLRFVRRTEVEIELSGPLPDLSSLSYTVQQMWGDLLLNRDDPRRDQGEGNQAATYIYIIPQDDRVSELLQPLYEWRRLEGFNVVEIQQVGNIEWLMQEIIEQNEIGNYPVEYICLVGDLGGEFSVSSFMRGTSDYPFGLLEGNDLLPDAAVGRISYNSLPELRRIIDKIMAYELEPNIEDVAWYRRGAVAAGSARSGFSTILVSKWAHDLMLRHNYTAVDTFWWTMGGGVANFMRNVFDRGALFVSYRGWTGLEDWTTREASRLDNEHPPVALLLACNAGDFDGIGSGFTEALLRADGGAIGAIGTVGFQARTNYNNALLAGYYRGVIEDGVCRLGWTLNRAKLELFAVYGASGLERVAGHAYWTNLMGDPGTVIWRGVPREVEIEIPEVIENGDGEFTVSVTTRNDEPVEGVRVGFYKHDEVISAAYTDENGEAQIVFDPDVVSEGEASITVSGDMVIPVTEEIQIRITDRLIVYRNLRILEDNMDPRLGNDDGVANPGEIIGLVVSSENIGTQAIRGGVQFTLSSEDESVTVLEDRFRYNNEIMSGGTVDASFLVRLNMNFPDREFVPLTLTAHHEDEEWVLPLGLLGAAPRWEITGIFMDEDPAPGAWINLSVTFTNSGQLDVMPFEAELVSLNDFADIQNPMVVYDTLMVGDTIDAVESFALMVDPETPWEITLPFEIQLVSNDDYEGVVPLDIQIQPRPSREPTGPDEYGYWAIDSRDGESSNIAPEYEWVEINPRQDGNGIDTRMLDQCEDNDKSIVLELPFTFQYYGEEYDELTVCTNGWAAFGDQSEYVDFRNLPIGSPQGPTAQLCPWWDDLYQPGIEGGVYYWYDEANHRFIVEWYRMRRWVGPAGPGASETFELILLDPLWHATYTGDGDIIFQYERIAHEARVDGHGTPYATIGIGDPSDRGGLQYGFWNRWANGAARVGSFSAIRFATARERNYAIVYGEVVVAENDEPVGGATVRVTPGEWTTTDDEGLFRIPDALAGRELDVTVFRPGFNTASEAVDPIVAGDSVEVVFQLTSPDISVNIESIIDTLSDEEEAVYDFNLSNTGNGELNYSIDFEAHQEERRAKRSSSEKGVRDEPDEDWERLFSHNVTDDTDDNRILGVVFTGDFFVVSGGNNGEMINYLYLFNEDGEYIDRQEQPCRAMWGMHDLAWDGERLYGACNGWIYSIALEDDDLDSISTPLIPTHGLAVDAENGDFWVANEGNPIHHLDAEGNVLGTFEQRLRPYGLAWRGDDPDGCPLYIFSADGENNLLVSKMNSESGEIISLTELELEPGDRAGGCELTPDWLGAHWVLTTVIQNSEGDRIELFDAGLNLTWISVEPQDGSIGPDDGQNCEVTISTIGIAVGEYAIDMVITHNAEGEAIRIPIFMTYESDIGGFESAEVETYKLDGIYPNPTNSAALISFHLPNPEQVSIVVLDQTGRQLMEVAEGYYTAGSHRHTMDTNNLPSGIYFIRLRTASDVSVRKFVLLK